MDLGSWDEMPERERDVWKGVVFGTMSAQMNMLSL